MTFKLFGEVCFLFFACFVTGSVACLPLYKWHLPAFFHSTLWTKIYWWIPIFTVLDLLLWFPVLTPIVTLLLLGQAWREFHRQQGDNFGPARVYGLIFTGAMIHLPLIGLLPSPARISALLSICFASVFSDVTAFFAGSYLGKHHLPAWINARKSWEGVLGQIAGAFGGLAVLASIPEIDFSWTLALCVGIASALGDILNSFAKRSLGIKDWGDAIPGHGGALDRFSSLSLALAAGFWLFY